MVLSPIDSRYQQASDANQVVIIPERPQDNDAIERLMNGSFGHDRRGRTVYQLRDGFKPVASLCFIAVDNLGLARASIRYWRISINGTDLRYLLLGPLAVDPAIRGGGLGKALVKRSLQRAEELAYDACLVVGEPSYYGDFGFTNASALGFELPGPVELRRFLIKEIKPGALSDITSRGMIAAYEFNRDH